MATALVLLTMLVLSLVTLTRASTSTARSVAEKRVPLRDIPGIPRHPMTPWAGRRIQLAVSPPPCFCTKTSGGDFAPLCGADYQSYIGACQATCGYAIPVVSPGMCNDCQKLCVLNPGQYIKDKTACPKGIQCKMPTWNPQFRAVAAKLRPKAKRPLCEYFKQQCTNVAQLYATGASSSSAKKESFFRRCFNCARMPCGGPSNTVPATSALCRAKAACKNHRTAANGRRVADLNCTYWNKRGKPL